MKIIYLCLFLFSEIVISAQTNPNKPDFPLTQAKANKEFSPSQKIVVVESFTNEYYDEISHDPNHGIIDGVFDQFAISQPIAFISTIFGGYYYYKASQSDNLKTNMTPYLFIDGELVENLQQLPMDIVYERIKPLIDSRLAEPAPVAIEIKNCRFKQEQYMVDFDVLYESLALPENTTAKLKIVITQWNKGELFSTSLNGSYEHIISWSLNQGEGTAIEFTSNGQTDSLHFTANTSFFERESPLELIAYIQNQETNEVYNAAKYWITPPNRNEIVFKVVNAVTNKSIANATISWDDHLLIHTNNEGIAYLAQFPARTMNLSIKHPFYHEKMESIIVEKDSTYTICMTANGINNLYYEDFNQYADYQIPDSWEIYPPDSNAILTKNKKLLFTYNYQTTKFPLIATTPTMNLSNSTFLFFKALGDYNGKLAVGYLSNYSDTSSFVTVQEFVLPTFVESYIKIPMDNFLESQSIAFKLVNGNWLSIDDVGIEGQAKNDNAFLDTIELSYGELEPDFNPSVFNYSVFLPEQWSFLPEIDATPQDSNATVIVSYTDALNPGCRIYIYAENEIDTNNYYINFITSITDDKANKQLHVFPNPASGNFNIISDAVFSKVSIYSMQGKLVETINFPVKVTQATIKTRLCGICIIECTLNNEGKRYSKLSLY